MGRPVGGGLWLTLIHHQNKMEYEKPRWYGILVESNHLKPAPTR
jgi:hypothetical protein